MSLEFTVSIRVGLAVLLAPAMLAAQTPKLEVRADTPEAVTRAYIGASKHQQWSMAVALMDPEEVASFGRVIGQLAAVPEADKQLRTAFMLGPQERLSTMEPPELMVRVLRLWAAKNPAAAAIAKNADFRIVGRVDDGHGQCYIVIAAVVRAGSMELPVAEVRSLRLTENGWRVRLPVEMTAVTAGFQAALQKR